ncbi:MAG: hypothetical protein BMS9Abin07_1739 [Acidimicrobiia bacterium]|nr:MAG: hypothetical protein BMS9Abin07_1739 [Acidimicrobiia bacterium]
MHGTSVRPRLAVFRSNRHIYAQVIDDDAGVTLAAASSREGASARKNVTVDTATDVGKLVASRAKDVGIERIVFDRGGFAYHGRVEALAEGAREAGLEF